MNDEGDGWAGRGRAIYWDEGRRNGIWLGAMRDGTRRLGVRVEGRLVALFELDDATIADIAELLARVMIEPGPEAN